MFFERFHVIQKRLFRIARFSGNSLVAGLFVRAALIGADVLPAGEADGGVVGGVGEQGLDEFAVLGGVEGDEESGFAGFGVEVVVLHHF